MKKLFSIAIISLFILGILGIDAFAINPAGPGKPGEIMGMASGRRASDPQRTFRLVRWSPMATAAYTLTADSIVIWDTTHDDGVTINTTTTSGDSRVAGVLVTAIVSADGAASGAVTLASDDVGKCNWGYLQTYGYATVNVSANSGGIAVGDAMGCGTIPGCAAALSPDVPSTGKNVAGMPGSSGYAGFFYDAQAALAKAGSTADASVECFIRCE